MEEQNIEASIGSVGENSNGVYQYTLRYTGRKQDVAEFENLVLVSKSTGEELRLKDVADVELGQSDYSYINRINGHAGVMGSISQVSGSNATRINQDIDKLLRSIGIRDIQHLTVPHSTATKTIGTTDYPIF